MLTRQRWGTFSVKDHLMEQAFIADVLMFDHLVIPYPTGPGERERWVASGWNPDALDKQLEILGDRATTFNWYKEEFADRFSKNRSELFSKEELKNSIHYHNDPFYMTRQIVAEEEAKRHEKEYIKIWTMPAYPSKRAFQHRPGQTPGEKKEKLASVISNRFLTPHDPKMPYEEALKEAVALSKDEGFIKKRALMHEWQENILTNDMTPEQAVNEMEVRLEEYNKMIRGAKKNVISKVAFLVVETSLGLAGAHLGEPLATATAMLSLAKFWKFDRKMEIDLADKSMVASMVYDARHTLNWD